MSCKRFCCETLTSGRYVLEGPNCFPRYIFSPAAFRFAFAYKIEMLSLESCDLEQQLRLEKFKEIELGNALNNKPYVNLFIQLR